MDRAGENPWSWAALEQNRRLLMRYVLTATGNMSVTEDVVQDVLRIAYEKRSKFTRGTDIGAWLRGIARNRLRQCFDEMKKSPVLVGGSMDALERVAVDNESTLIDDTWQRRRLRALRRCLRKLDEKVRRILQSRYGNGESARQLAKLHGMTVSAIDVLVFRARAALRKCMRRNLET